MFRNGTGVGYSTLSFIKSTGLVRVDGNCSDLNGSEDLEYDFLQDLANYRSSRTLFTFVYWTRVQYRER